LHSLCNGRIPYRNSPGRCSWASADEVVANPALYLQADCWSWQSLCQCVDATTRDQATQHMPLRSGRVDWHGMFVPLGSDFALNDNEQLPDCRLVKCELCNKTCMHDRHADSCCKMKTSNMPTFEHRRCSWGRRQALTESAILTQSDCRPLLQFNAASTSASSCRCREQSQVWPDVTMT